MTDIDYADPTLEEKASRLYDDFPRGFAHNPGEVTHGVAVCEMDTSAVRRVSVEEARRLASDGVRFFAFAVHSGHCRKVGDALDGSGPGFCGVSVLPPQKRGHA